MFDNTIFHNFEGFDVRIPSEYDSILTKLYGNYMELPPVEQRKPLHMTEHVSCNMPYGDYLAIHKDI